MRQSSSILSGVIRPSISADAGATPSVGAVLPESDGPGTLIQSRAVISVPVPTHDQAPAAFHTDDSRSHQPNSTAGGLADPTCFGGAPNEDAREEGPRRPVTQTVPQDIPSTTQTPSVGVGAAASAPTTQQSTQQSAQLATQPPSQPVDASQVLGLVMESLAEGVCLCDLQGQIVWANNTFKQIDQVARNNIGAACQQAALSFLQQFEAPNSAVNPRTRFDAGTEDQTKCYEASLSPVRDPATGRPTHVAAVVYDVTAARRVAQKMDAIDRAGTELVRLDADTIRKMNTAERLRVLEKKIIGFAHDLLHFDHFAIRLIDEKSGKLELVMSCGLPQEAMEVELFARSEGNGISGYVASTGRSYTCADTAKDPRYVIGIAAARSSLTIPLRTSEKIIGVFNIESELPNNFTEQDRQFGEMFAMYIAMALHILDLLVVERSATGKAVTGTVEGELSEPLDDIAQVTTRLRQALAAAQNPGASAGAAGSPAGQTQANPATTVPLDPSITRFIERILADVDSIKRRMKDVAAGPATILGAEKCIAESALDPLLVGRRVLVADDDPRIRQIIRDVLRGRGAEVTICENGTQAMEAIDLLCRGKDPSAAAAGTSAGPGQERHVGTAASTGTPSKFDLIISDIKMPDRTGYDIFSMARRVMSGVPVILMTGFGYDPHHSIVRASQEGLSCVLFKPFQAERLIEEVHKALAKKG